MIPGSLIARPRVSPDEALARVDRAVADRLERSGASEGGLTDREERELAGRRRREREPRNPLGALDALQGDAEVES